MKEKTETLTRKELQIISRLNKPYKVQEFVDLVKYNAGKRISVADVLRQKKGDCLEAACFALFALRYNGYDAFLIDLSVERDEDHVLCVFKENGLYGAIAQSKFLGLRYRHPVYKTLRELAMSYFESYFNFYGYLSLRNYSKMSLKNLENEWIFSSKKIISIENAFSDLKHEQIVRKGIQLPAVSKLRFQRDIVILPDYVKVGKRYK
ncbi:MAG: hypothetical protein ACP5N3_00160 [Candidatus Nanoarchaeia archaeon]